MLSVHTSPLDQPGTGDAGGMNVYVVELSRRLAAAGWRSTSSLAPRPGGCLPWWSWSRASPAAHVVAGPFEVWTRRSYSHRLCASPVTARNRGAQQPGHYDDGALR